MFSKKSWFFCCVVCRKWLGRHQLFCSHCRLKWQSDLGVYSRNVKVDSKSFEHIYFIPWHKYSDFVVRPVIYGLKGGLDPDRRDELFASSALQTMKLFRGRGTQFIPAPAKKWGQEDHACTLAKWWEENSEGQLHQVLRRKNEGRNQHQSSLQVRRTLEMDPVSLTSGAENIVFIDDVFTSGATAIAAFRALGQPKGFKVWTLSYRHK